MIEKYAFLDEKIESDEKILELLLTVYDDIEKVEKNLLSSGDLAILDLEILDNSLREIIEKTFNPDLIKHATLALQIINLMYYQIDYFQGFKHYLETIVIDKQFGIGKRKVIDHFIKAINYLITPSDPKIIPALKTMQLELEYINLKSAEENKFINHFITNIGFFITLISLKPEDKDDLHMKMNRDILSKIRQSKKLLNIHKILLAERKKDPIRESKNEIIKLIDELLSKN